MKPIRVVSLFCGVGGSDLGLYAAARDLGIEVRVVAAYDSDPKAVAIYNANLPHATASVADVKALTRADLPPHDLVIGGPACQPYSVAGKRAGADDPRDCLPDFLRLVGSSPFLMENVVPRLIPNVSFSVKLNAFDFGDVTTRKRWFYSSHLLHVIETPGPRRFGDIRDHDADAAALGRRKHLEKVSPYADADALSSLTAHSWHGHETRTPTKLVEIQRSPAVITHGALGPTVRCPSLLEMQRAHSFPDDFVWCGATKTARGRYIANSWPIGLATAVCRAMLVALGTES